LGRGEIGSVSEWNVPVTSLQADLDEAYDYWKAADLEWRTAELDLVAAWHLHDWMGGPAPAADLLARVGAARDDAKEKLNAAIELMKQITGVK
jgi:hypothetical protein